MQQDIPRALGTSLLSVHRALVQHKLLCRGKGYMMHLLILSLLLTTKTLLPSTGARLVSQGERGQLGTPPAREGVTLGGRCSVSAPIPMPRSHALFPCPIPVPPGQPQCSRPSTGVLLLQRTRLPPRLLGAAAARRQSPHCSQLPQGKEPTASAMENKIS